MFEMITVKATQQNGRVVLWEDHPQHPNGMAWVTGDGKAVQVANTPIVQSAIRTGRLVVVVEEPPAEAEASQAEPADEPAAEVEVTQDEPPAEEESTKSRKRKEA